VGTNGQINDATIWRNCKLKELLVTNKLNIPDPAPMPLTDTQIPYHFIGDDIFPLTSYMMKPYPRQTDIVDMPRRIFDYR
jgi:hypothetical protein